MKHLIICLIACSGFFNLHAQELPTPPYYFGSYPSDTLYVQSALSAIATKYKFSRFPDCQQNLICSFRFNIDTLGNIKNLVTSKETPLFLFNFIDSALSTTNGKWMPSILNGKKVFSKPCVLPVIYLWDTGCANSSIKKESYCYWTINAAFMFNFNEQSIRHATVEKKHVELEKNIKLYHLPLDYYIMQPAGIQLNVLD